MTIARGVAFLVLVRRPRARPRSGIASLRGRGRERGTRDEDETENESSLSRKSRSLNCTMFNHTHVDGATGTTMKDKGRGASRSGLIQVNPIILSKPETGGSRPYPGHREHLSLKARRRPERKSLRGVDAGAQGELRPDFVPRFGGPFVPHTSCQRADAPRLIVTGARRGFLLKMPSQQFVRGLSTGSDRSHCDSECESGKISTMPLRFICSWR